MTYEHIWKKVLNENEQIQYEFSVGPRYRWVGIITGCIIGLIAFPLAIFIIPAFCFVYGFYLKAANAYAFTDKRALIHTGWLSTKTITIDYNKITDVKVIEPFFERIICHTGSLTINTAGLSDDIVFRHIARPYETKKKLDELRQSGS